MARPFERLTSLSLVVAHSRIHPWRLLALVCEPSVVSIGAQIRPRICRAEKISLLADRHVIVVFLQSYSVQIGFFSRLKLFVAVLGRVVLLLHGFSLQQATALLEEAGGQCPEKELRRNVNCVTYRRP